MSLQFNARKAIEVLADNEGESATREKLKILNQLSTIPNVNIIPVEVLQLVIQILGETENRMIINSILSAIQHLASFERTRMLLGDETNCIQLLVPHMSQFNFPNIQSGALDAMAELLKGSKKNQENLIQYVGDFFNPLMGIIQRENDSVTKKAFAVLDSLFENPFCIHAVFGDKNRYDEYLEPLIICLQIENNRLVLQWALQTIEKACKQNLLYSKHLLDIGIIDSLVQIILDPRHVSAQAVKISALNALIHCVKYSNEAGLWAGESGIVEPIIEIMHHTSLELNSSNISLSYAQSIETQDLREACFELAMNLTNFESGRSHARMLNPTTIIASTDTDLAAETPSTPKEEKQVKLEKLDVDTKILNPYFDENEEKKENPDILVDNKKKFITHSNGLNVLFAYIGQEEPNEKSDLKYKKHVKQIRKMAIMIISNISTIAENGVTILTREQKLLSFDHPMNIVDLLLDIIIHKKEHEKDSTKTKRRVDDGKDLKLDMKQCIINAMGSFALHDVCIEKLGEMGVIKRLLKMIDEKNEASEIAKLLAKMCEHNNFQKVLFEEAGLARVVKLLEAQDNPEDRLAGLMICLPLASNPNGCVALSRDGIDKKIRDISKREVVFEDVRKMAKQVIKILKENNKSSLRATKAAVGGGSDENGKPINNMNIFKFNYEQVARIDKEFVKVCEERICSMLDNPKFKLQINWRQVERLGDINFSDEAITLLGRLDLYEEFFMAIEAFIEAAEINANIFNANVPLVVLEVLPPAKKEENSKKKDDEEDEAVPCELEIGDLIMKYKLSPDGILWTPKQLAGLISYELLGYDIIELNDMLIGDGEEDRDDQFELGIDQLKKICKDSRLALLGDINLLYFHIETTDLLWKAGFAESQQIVASKSIVSDEELFIKGWRILKMNKDGMLQERILLLTNTSYYTVCFDPKSKKIDYKHTKHHNIEDYFLCDVGKIVKSRHDSTSSTVHLHEDGRNKYALNLVTNEKPHVSKSQTKLEEEAEELEKIKRLSSVFHTAELKSQLSAISNSDILSQSDDTISTEEELNKSLVTDEDQSERPSTAGKYCSIFLCPDTVPRGKQKFYLQEIAWCFRAVACCATRTECHSVFNRDIVKPIEGKLARFYNLTGMGKKKDNSIIAKHMENKMRREQEKQEERVKQAQVKGAKNIKEK